MLDLKETKTYEHIERRECWCICLSCKMRQRFDKPALNFFGDTFGILNWISKGPIVEFRPIIKSPLSQSSQSWGYIWISKPIKSVSCL